LTRPVKIIPDNLREKAHLIKGGKELCFREVVCGSSGG
jgi:hypothetical protein